MITCTAQVGIRRAPEVVTGYLSEVPNLPSWTSFFQSVGTSADGRRYPVTTAMGELVTWIEATAEPEDVTACTIHSLVKGREEQAVLRVRRAEDGSGTEVEFTVRLPADAPEQRAGRQRDTMANELRRLREQLEGIG